MRALALTAALATALTGTGCIVSSNDPAPTGQVNLYWAFLRYAPAQTPTQYITYDGSYAANSASGTCPESDVDTVRVEANGRVETIECTGPSGGGWAQGVVLANLPAGRNYLTITGLRASVAVYQAVNYAVDVPAWDFVDEYVDLPGLHADVEAYADLAGGNPAAYYANCAEALNPNVTVDVYDYAGTLIDSQTAGCNDPLPAYVYLEDLDYDDYWVRMTGTLPGSSTLVFDSCDQLLQHYGVQAGASGFLATLYTAPLPVCP